MAHITSSIIVAASPCIVFDLFTDLERVAEANEDIVSLEKLTDGPMAGGSRFRETRFMFKRETTEEFEVTAFEPGKSYSVECVSCGCVYSTVYRFSPEKSGTRVDFEMRTRAVSFFAKLLSPIGMFFTGSLKKCLEHDIAQLKATAETMNTQVESSA